MLQIDAEYIDRTDRGVTRPQLFHLSARSENIEGDSPRLLTTRREVEKRRLSGPEVCSVFIIHQA